MLKNLQVTLFALNELDLRKHLIDSCEAVDASFVSAIYTSVTCSVATPC